MANTVRIEMRRLRATVKSAGRRGGALEAARIVEAGESRIRVIALLEAIDKMGEITARRLLRRLDIDPLTRVDGLTQQRRELLVEALRRMGEAKRR